MPGRYWLALTVVAAGCGSQDPSGSDDVAISFRGYFRTHLVALSDALENLAVHAPRDRAWNAQADPALVERMRTAWKAAHRAAVAVTEPLSELFPQAGRMDSNWDREIDRVQRDENPFDDIGVTGLHAIERILWADVVSEMVLTVERRHEGYAMARTPATAKEAADYATQLVGGLHRDAQALAEASSVPGYDLGFAEKAVKLQARALLRMVIVGGEPGRSESRYSDTSTDALVDQLGALAGTWKILRAALRRQGVPVGSFQVADAGLERVHAAVAAIGPGPIPARPEGFNPFHPTQEDRESAFGRLYFSVEAEILGASSDAFLAALGNLTNAVL